AFPCAPGRFSGCACVSACFPRFPRFPPPARAQLSPCSPCSPRSPQHPYAHLYLHTLQYTTPHHTTPHTSRAAVYNARCSTRAVWSAVWRVPCEGESAHLSPLGCNVLDCAVARASSGRSHALPCPGLVDCCMLCQRLQR